MARFLLPLIFFGIAAGAAVLAVPMLVRTPPAPPKLRPLFPEAPDEPPVKRVSTPELLARLENLAGDAPQVTEFLSRGAEARQAVLERLRSKTLPAGLMEHVDELDLDPADLLAIARDPALPFESRGSAYFVLHPHRTPEVRAALQRAILEEENLYPLFGAVQAAGLQADSAYCEVLLERFEQEYGSSIEPPLLRALGQSRCMKALRPMEVRLTAIDAPVAILLVGVKAAMQIEVTAGRRIGQRILDDRDDLPKKLRAAIKVEVTP